MTAEREPTAAEIEALQREQFYADPEAVTTELYPRATNLSAGHLYRRVIRPLAPVPPEYLTLPLPRIRDEEGVRLDVMVAQWNLLWEAAQLRRRFFAKDDLPPVMYQVADRGDVNVVFVPRTDTRNVAGQQVSAPRTRGWFAPARVPPTRLPVGPAHAGMVPGLRDCPARGFRTVDASPRRAASWQTLRAPGASRDLRHPLP
jgi:hypothetical protein